MSQFKITNFAKRQNESHVEARPVMPKVGAIIEPERRSAQILIWPSQWPNSWIAKINRRGRAVVSHNDQGATITCLLHTVPMPGQGIKITKVNEHSVKGEPIDLNNKNSP